MSEKCVQGLLFFDIEQVYLAVVSGDCIWFEFDAMVPFPEWWKGSRGFFF